MNNNAIVPTEGSVSPSVPIGAILCNDFLAVDNDVSIDEPGVERLPAFSPRTAYAASSGQVLAVVGLAEITAANCNLFRKTACAAWNGQTDIEIDLSETTFIDCAGLGALIAVRNLTRGRNGVARLMNPSSKVQQLLDLTRAGQLFEIVNSRGTDPASVARHN